MGLKVTEMVQWAFAARLVPQVLVWAKSPGLAPLKEKLLMGMAIARLLVRVTDLAALVVPTVCGVNASQVGEAVAQFGLENTVRNPWRPEKGTWKVRKNP